MSHRYFPHTEADVEAMCRLTGIATVEELFADVPESLRLKRPYQLPAAKSEKEVRDFFETLGEKNRRLACFAGGGFYNHYTPAVVSSLAARSEFLTAYTPYQPEISQGTLQYIFEYQTIMSRLTGLEICNASMYDGATATAEAMIMSVASARKRHRVLASATLNPAVREVVDTYARYQGITVDTIAEADGVTDLEDLQRLLQAGDVAGVILPTPNYHGIVEDYTGVAEMCHAVKALLIMNCVAIDLATVKSPGEWGADIAVGDAQSLGMPLNYGGPYLGFLCATKALMRKMPGRIVGATTDDRGNRVFVLTLQAREQHIRREKATSNICSNQGVMTLCTAIYCSLLGLKGLREVNNEGAKGAHYLALRLVETGKVELMYPGKPFINEFVVKVNFDLDSFMAKALEHGILAGIKTGPDELLIAVTEMNTRDQIDRYVSLVKSL